MLTTNLTRDQKDMIDEVLLELGSGQKRETELIYRQGLEAVSYTHLTLPTT